MCLTCTIQEVTGLDLSTDEGHEKLAALGRIPWPEATAEMQRAAALVSAMYAFPAGDTGGPLHVTTDDLNVEDSSLLFCRRNLDTWVPYDATEEEGEQVRLLARWILDLLEPMTDAERSVAISLGHGDVQVFRPPGSPTGKVYMPSTEFPIREHVLDDEGRVIGHQRGFRSRTVEGQ